MKKDILSCFDNVSFIPIIGIFWLILLWLLKSEEKDNKYGTYQNAH